MQLSKELKRKLLLCNIKLMSYMAMGGVALYFILPYTMQHDNILIGISPVFVMLFIFALLCAGNNYYGKKTVEEIHGEYAKNIINMPFSKLSPALINRSLIPYVMPKIFKQIMLNNTVWDDESLIISSPSLKDKLGSTKIADIKRAYETLTPKEQQYVDQAYVTFVTAKVISSPADQNLKALGIS